VQATPPLPLSPHRTERRQRPSQRPARVEERETGTAQPLAGLYVSPYGLDVTQTTGASSL